MTDISNASTGPLYDTLRTAHQPSPTETDRYLREHALQIAVQFCTAYDTNEDVVVDVAGKFYGFLKGE